MRSNAAVWLVRLVTLSALLNFSSGLVSAQETYLKEEFRAIMPLKMTISDVEKIYKNGEILVQSDQSFLSKAYDLNSGGRLIIDYFTDCRSCANKAWIVKSVTFSFDWDSTLEPSNVYSSIEDFSLFSYGDVVGQLLFESSDRLIRISYSCSDSTVTSIIIDPSKEELRKFRCAESKVTFGLDRSLFVPLDKKLDLKTVCARVLS